MDKVVLETVFEQKVLDHGYVKLIETWGSDERIIEAARMSTDKGFQGWGPKPCPGLHNAGPEHPYHVEIQLLDGWLGGGKGEAHLQITPCNACKGTGFVPGDERLLEYLWTNKHATPFEMAGLIVEVQAPIAVFREWHRHRTQSYNELSARYTVLPDLYYVPSIERIMAGAQSTSNKQASAEGISLEDAKFLQGSIATSHHVARAQYEGLMKKGLSRELARMVIPVAQYSRMRASANLRNWLAFLTLRMDTKAQWEIRQYANIVGEMIAATFPRTWGLFKS
jgi:thymidylate synthase (FAD)